MSNNKKAVFFDIDGTIFMPNLGVTEKTKEAIVKLNENGIIPVICTGRSRSMIFKSIMDIGFKDVVAGAGTYVEVNSEEIYRVDMKPEDIDEIVEAMVKYGFNPIPEGHDNLYYKDDINTAKYKEIFDLYYSELSEFMKPIRKGETYAAKVSGQFTDKSNKQAMIELFADRYDIVDHRGVLLELIPAGFSKATGIEVEERPLTSCSFPRRRPEEEWHPDWCTQRSCAPAAFQRCPSASSAGTRGSRSAWPRRFQSCSPSKSGSAAHNRPLYPLPCGS